MHDIWKICLQNICLRKQSMQKRILRETCMNVCMNIHVDFLGGFVGKQIG